MKTSPPSFIVGIGGSAGGGLNAYRTLLNALPSRTGMAFVIVSHIHPDASSQLAQLLSRDTDMPVLVVSSGMAVRANHVYVIPPNADLLLEGDAFKLVSPRIERNTQVDVFFISLAEAVGTRAIGIIVSGYDGDGTKGCKHIKERGGVTFAQDGSAEIGEMPLSAQRSGYVDFVLALDKMSDALQKLARERSPDSVGRHQRDGRCVSQPNSKGRPGGGETLTIDVLGGVLRNPSATDPSRAETFLGCPHILQDNEE
ncbi:MAG: chemotaxis protein CheB [Acidiferrobacteraceae bacterium]